jgi:HEAT repeat protein
MRTKWLYLLMLFLIMGCQQSSIGQPPTEIFGGQDEPASPVSQAPAEAEVDASRPGLAETDKELNIYKSTLFEGKTEQIRIDAATVMLFREEPAARKILLDALKQTENGDARAAVCKALSQIRGMWKAVKKKEDFIQPLLDTLTTVEDSVIAKLAAEATLVFEYDQISEQLEKIVTDTSLSVRARLNAVYALELHPDMRVAVKLITLLDDPERQVATAAEEALYYLGIQAGKDAESRRRTVAELERQGPEAFLRNLLIRQEARMRGMTIELNLWQGLYLAALSKIYDGISDEAAKGKFLAEHLGSSESVVKLWVLEKAYQWRVRPGSRLPVEFKSTLVKLISDQNRDVRLKTAKLLSLIGEINSAQPLLTQLETEQDDDVRTELLVALGGACYYASLPDSPIKIPPETRQQTIEWAVKYLLEQEPKKAQKGAEVMKKLLEQDGLSPAEVDKYLGFLAEKYSQQKNKTDGALSGELLNAMAGLCAQTSACRVKAAKLFGPLFEEALYDSTDLVREAAVEGLVYIDKARALNRLRKDFVNDLSIVVRKKLIGLAGEVGGKEDLVWLAEKMGSNAESELAWQAMLKIFNSSDATILSEWMDKCSSEDSQIKLSNEQKSSFLEVAQQKATTENKPEMLRDVRWRLARLHSKGGEFERAAGYLGKLYEAAQTAGEKGAILPDLLDVYLRWPNVQLAVELVENCLLERDLGPDNVVVQSIDNYMSNPPAGADPNIVLEALTRIKIPKGRPMWQQRLKMWANRLGKAKDADKPEKGSS